MMPVLTHIIAPCLLIAAFVGGAPARAAESPPPILDDSDAATRLDPLPGAFSGPVVKEVVDEPEPEPDPMRDWSVVSFHTRWVTIPDFIMGAIFDAHPSYQNVSAGLGIEFGSIDDAMWVIEIDWTPLITDSGNWLPAGDDILSANYGESSLHMISIDVSYRWYYDLTPDLHWFVGSGIGIAALAGDLELSEVLPTCEAPVERCAHWREATKETVDLPTRILPVLHLMTGFQYSFGQDAMVRLSAGFRDVFYVGLSAGMAL